MTRAARLRLPSPTARRKMRSSPTLSRRLGVLHHDHDCDIIVEHASLSFAGVWAAPRGTPADRGP
ncbi:MAG TPA: hypothetical protein VMF09_06525 [Solirubrobacteraceae bacterium]|nr:hypothetical protein [Solirubrobacteraceae bacterium]